MNILQFWHRENAVHRDIFCNYSFTSPRVIAFPSLRAEATSAENLDELLRYFQGCSFCDTLLRALADANITKLTKFAIAMLGNYGLAPDGSLVDGAEQMGDNVVDLFDDMVLVLKPQPGVLGTQASDL